MASMMILLAVFLCFGLSLMVVAVGYTSIATERQEEAENQMKTSRFFSVLSQDGKAVRVRAIDESIVRRVQEHLREEHEVASDFVTDPSAEKLHRPTLRIRRRVVG